MHQPLEITQNGKRVCTLITTCSDWTLKADRARNNSWSLLVSIIFIVVFCAVAWFASPKGETQTYVLLSSPGLEPS